MVYYLAITVLIGFGLFAAFGVALGLLFTFSRFPSAVDDALEGLGISESVLTVFWTALFTVLGLAMLFVLASAISHIV